MTLLECTQTALVAAAEGDLETLGEALETRAAMLTELSSSPSTPGSEAELRAAIEMGQKLVVTLRTLKRRHRVEYGRLQQLKNGLAAGFGAGFGPHIDCSG